MTAVAALDLYQGTVRGAGFLDRSERVRIEVAGPDRARFLHNLTTHDVKRLTPGAGFEAFVTSPQGKTLGYVTLIACDDRILLRTDPEGLATLLPHLQKYGVFDDVTVEDVGGRTFEFHLAGPRALEIVSRVGGALPGEASLSHLETRVAGAVVRVIREAPTGLPGLTLVGAAGDAPAVAAVLRAEGRDLGLVELTPDLFEELRIEAGTPVFGRDVTADNLPQEVGRDDRAISFVKGCYLGQETVARIDALGHVNKVLKGLRLPGARACPAAGSLLERDGKPVGTITSSAFSPGLGEPVALGYVRSAQAVTGTELAVLIDGESRRAIVCDLPMRPAGDPSAS